MEGSKSYLHYRCLRAVWAAIPQDLIRRLVESLPRRLAAVVRARGYYTLYLEIRIQLEASLTGGIEQLSHQERETQISLHELVATEREKTSNLERLRAEELRRGIVVQELSSEFHWIAREQQAKTEAMKVNKPSHRV